MRRRLALAVVTTAAVFGMVAGTAGTANAALNVNWNWAAGFLPNLANSAKAPAGAENLQAGGGSSCNWQASPNHLPLILVHGTWEHQADNFTALSPYFKNQGYCVYTLNYGGNKGDIFWGWQSISGSAGQLKTYVDQVLAATGAPKVDLLGHSQGGVMPRYYIKFLGGDQKVNKFVGLASSNNGTTLSGLAKFAKFVGITEEVALVQPAAIDQTIGSNFMNTVNSCPGTTQKFNVCANDPVKYTVLQTNGDQVVTPYTGAFLTEQNPATTDVTNITVNNQCILELAEHLGMTYSQNVATRAARALDGTTQAKCVVSLPYIGG